MAKKALKKRKRPLKVPEKVVNEGLDGHGKFLPGHRISVGNIGRTRDFITQQLISALHEAVDPKDPKSPARVRALVDKMIAVAMDGNVHAFVAICDQVQGRPRQRVDITGFDGYSAIRIETVFVEKGPDGKIIEHEPIGTNTARAETEVYFEDAVRPDNAATDSKEKV